MSPNQTHVWISSAKLFIIVGGKEHGFVYRVGEKDPDSVITDAIDYAGLSEEDRAFLQVAFDYEG